MKNKGKSKLYSSATAIPSESLAASPRSTYVAWASLIARAAGAPRVDNVFLRKWVGRARHPFQDLWLVSVDAGLECVAPIAISKDELQSLLVIFLHGLLILAYLGMKGRRLTFRRLEL